MRGMGKRLRARALELGISDSEVARRLGVSQTRYAKYVTDVNEPDLVTVVKLCRLLGMAPEEILGLAEMPVHGERDLLMARLQTTAQTMGTSRLRAAVAVIDALSALPEL